MKCFKGTPGPWHVMRGDVLDKNGRMVACIEGFCPGEIEMHDAKLIAAAPDLLEALQAAIDYINAIPKDVVLPAMPGFDRDWVDGVISKALGEE